MFKLTTARTLTTTGWVVTGNVARREYRGGLRGRVTSDGAWAVNGPRGDARGAGIENDPAYAAMDANECAWRQPEYMARGTLPDHGPEAA